MTIDGTDVTNALPIIKMAAPAVLAGIGRSFGWATDKVREHFALAFKDHLEATKRKCMYVRTINAPDYATELSDIYVNLVLRNGDQLVEDVEVLSKLENYRSVLITGTAGAGKSMLMRHLALQALTPSYDHVPLFIDLRDIADTTTKPLLDGLFELVTPDSQRKNREIFDKSLDSGAFCLFLDGLDEVPPNSRDELRKQLEGLIIRFPTLKIIMSSRPEIDFSGWEDFSIFSLEPLNRSQTRLVIDKCSYPTELKERFLSQLDEGAFDQHNSFLQVPLLSVILLMCFGEYLELSEHTTSFYDQAFEVLYRRHDRNKGLKRKHFSELPAELFRKVVSAFCFRSLVDHSVSFTEDELSQYLYKSALQTEIKVDPTALAQDLVESVSMMQRDGSKIYFIHRTFQEYFSAQFIVRYRGDETFKVYDALIPDTLATNVAGMVAEMDLVGLEREWVKPVVDNILARIGEIGEHDYAKILRHFFVQISINAGVDGQGVFSGLGWSVSNTDTSRVRTIEVLYRESDVGLTSISAGQALCKNGGSVSELFDEPTFPKKISEKYFNGKFEEGFHYSIDTNGPELAWMSKTDIPLKIENFLGRLRTLQTELTNRIAARSSTSIFS